MTLIINKHSLIARKGPRKYFTLRLSDLETDKDYFLHFDPNHATTQEEYDAMLASMAWRNYAFAPVFRSINDSSTVGVYHSTYTVGKHAQISWLDVEMTWVVASQHASLFIRSLDDLKAYGINQKSPYYVPSLIAEYWLKFFDSKISDKSEFQAELNGKTLCGTYIDNSKFDCLVRYQRPSLVFHAIVDNETNVSSCLSPTESYDFFSRWGLSSTPLTKVGEYNNFDDIRNDIYELHNSISHSTVKDHELGSVLYFVEKGENKETVLSMAKIETKEALALQFLVDTLRAFWINKENISTWDDRLDIEYNDAYNHFMMYLESLTIHDFDGYKQIAQTAFKSLKDDLELYKKLKTDIPRFFSILYSSLGYGKGYFDSTVLKLQRENSHTPKVKKEETKSPSFEDEEIKISKEEDAIDRLMKNEYIRKNSKIDYEQDQPLENIIGSEKAKVVAPTPKNKSKKGKKKAKTTRKSDLTNIEAETPKTEMPPNPFGDSTPDTKSTQQFTEEETPRPQAHSVTPQESFESPVPHQSTKVESKPTPKSSKPAQKSSKPAEKAENSTKSSSKSSKKTVKITEKQPEPNLLKSILINITPYDLKLLSQDKKQRHILLPVEYTIDEGYKNDNLDITKILGKQDRENSYLAVKYEGDQCGQQLHLVPQSKFVDGHLTRIYDTYRPFGFKKQRAVTTINGNRVDCVVYDKNFSRNLIQHTFSPDGVGRVLEQWARRSYKAHQYLYFKNVNHWFASFRIYSNFFTQQYYQFLSRVGSIVYGTEKNFYSPIISPLVFRSVPAIGFPVLTLLTKAGQCFTKLLNQFLSHSKPKKPNVKKSLKEGMCEKIEQFITNAPTDFWTKLYNPCRITLADEESKAPESLDTSFKNKTLNKSSKKSQKTKKKVENKGKTDDAFMAQFQKLENELEKSLKGSKNPVNEAKLPVVTTPHSKPDAEWQKSAEKPNDKKQQSKGKKSKAEVKKQEEHKGDDKRAKADLAKKEKAEKEKAEKERKDKEKADKLEKEKQAKAIKDQQEKEKREKAEEERKEKLKADEERKEKEKLDKIEKDKQAKIEHERKEQEKLAKLEEEKKIKEKRAQEKKEKELKKKQDEERKAQELKGNLNPLFS